MSDRGNILIADDNPNNLKVLLGLLSPAGYKIRPALSGEIALKAAEHSPPDLILLDVQMPGLNGYQTCELLKRNEATKDIPVIFISAMQDTEDKIAGFKAGAVDYIAKPFQSEEVLARVQTHIQFYHIKRQLEQMVKDRTAELEKSEAFYRVIFEDNPIAIIVLKSKDLSIISVNHSFKEMLGYTPEESIGQPLVFIAQNKHRDKLISLLENNLESAAYTAYPIVFQHKNGDEIQIEGVLQRVNYPGYEAQIFMFQDVTEKKQAEAKLQIATQRHKQQIKRLEYFDLLTGLPNRTFLTERMAQALNHAVNSDTLLAVCYLDIDDFKPINEKNGKEIGDKLLINVADCLRQSLRGGDVVARIGGDEFAFLLMGLKSREEIAEQIDRLLERLARPFISDNWHITLTASIGLTIFPRDVSEPDTLLRHAYQAMTAAKQSGHGHYAFFDPENDKRQRNQYATIETMRSALKNNEFVLYYQPKVDIKANTVFGAEALIRWNHPERGLLPPGVFLPSIEGDNFMIELGDWVIEEAIRQSETWNNRGIHLSISINIAAQQLAQNNFIQKLSETMARHNHPALGKIELEVLETSTLEDIYNVEKIISACREIGIGFSLDDFGTGYSSLTYLRRLSADTLKIDQSFIRDMMQDPGDQAIVAGIIGLAKAFNRHVIAEGVETVEHAKFLLNLGCSKFQGYGIARPMPADDIPDWLTSWPTEEWQTLIPQ